MEKSNSFSVYQQDKMYMDPILKETDKMIKTNNYMKRLEKLNL